MPFIRNSKKSKENAPFGPSPYTPTRPNNTQNIRSFGKPSLQSGPTGNSFESNVTRLRARHPEFSQEYATAIVDCMFNEALNSVAGESYGYPNFEVVPENSEDYVSIWNLALYWTGSRIDRDGIGDCVTELKLRKAGQ